MDKVARAGFGVALSCVLGWLLALGLVPAAAQGTLDVPDPVYHWYGPYGLGGGPVKKPEEAAAAINGTYAGMAWWPAVDSGQTAPLYCSAQAPTFAVGEFAPRATPNNLSQGTVAKGVPATWGQCTAYQVNPGGFSKCVGWSCVSRPIDSYNMLAECPVGWEFRAGGRCECPANQQLVRGSDGRWGCGFKCTPHIDNPSCWQAGGSCGAGNPILPDVATKLQQEVDYEGAGAHALSFRRTFRSNAARPYVEPGSWSHWVHNWGRRIETYPASGYASSPAFVIRDDASQRIYTNNGSAVWTAWQLGDRNRLIEDRNTSGVRTGFRYLVWADDSVEHYDAQGRLHRVVQRNGWTTTLGYSTSTTLASVAPRPGLLISVRNHFGRELRLTYDAAGRLLELLPPGAVAGSAPGSATSPIRYGHAEPAGLGAGVPAANQLTSVTWQDGAVRRYHYEHTQIPGLLSGITDELGVRIGTYLYTGTGRVYSTQGPNGSNRVDLSHDGLSSRVIDYSTGSPLITTYTWQQVQGLMRPLAVSAPCPLCGNSMASTAYTSTGEVARSVGHDGRVTFFTYDSRGRETQRAEFPAAYNTATTRPALSLAERVVTTQWHATWNLPLQRSEPGSIQWWTYSSKGQVLTERRQATTDPSGATGLAALKTGVAGGRTFSYTTTGLQATATEVLDTSVSTSWTYTYNAQGDPTRVVATEAGVSSTADLTSSAQGQLTRLAASNGALATYSYTARGGLASAQLPGLNLSITRDARALPTRLDTSAGTWLRIEYDATGVPTQVTDSSGGTNPVLASGVTGGEQPSVAQGKGRTFATSRQALLERLPLPSAKAQPLPGPAISRAIAQGVTILPASQVRPVDPTDPGCCGGQPRAASHDFRVSFDMSAAPGLLAYNVATSLIAITVNDTLIWKSARKLRRNMACKGITKPETGCCDAHHIVHRNGYDLDAVAQSKAVLEAATIKIDDWENGVYLDCSKHRDTQNAGYDQLVRDELVAIPPANRTRAIVGAKLQEIGLALKKGGGC